MNKWFLRKVFNNYELYCNDDNICDKAPILELIDIIKNKYDDAVFQDDYSNVMYGEYGKKVIINGIEFSISEELYTLVFSTENTNGNHIILEISEILNAQMQ
ncbi:hypothetical protein R4K48_11605 [Brachyspira pulli]|uniref:hypothetical protein n=1 Tax=Brachyspira pulli TaxID=310721 RepID=UPI003006FB75